MNIIVTIKQVADPAIPPANIELDSTGKRIISPFGIRPVINGYDANALEEALRLREQHGGRVTVVSLGDDSTRESLKYAVAMGADQAVLFNDAEWLNADSAGVGQALAASIKKIGSADLILCGRQASDTDAGQVLYWTAARLGLPVTSPISKIEEINSQTMIVHRLTEEGYQRLQIKLPAVLGISSEINEPRYPRPKGIMAAGRTLIPGWKASEVGLPPLAYKVELRQLRVQAADARAEIIEAESNAQKSTALARKLHELGVI